MLSLDHMSASDIVAAFRAGTVSAREIAEASLAAVSEREERVHAFVEVCPDLAYEAAERLDAMRAAGEELPALAGVPIAIKDNMNLKGTKTTCSSNMLSSYESAYTATAVERMLRAGCIPVGKANMDEFAFGSTTENSAFGPTNNPWGTTRVPGGSSGGSAAAVAAGEACLSLGSDTGGSIRQPAAFCGVVGMKPTYGAVSRYGVVAFGSSLDQVGPFGRCVEDVARAMNALFAGGRDDRDSTSRSMPCDCTAHLADDMAGKRVGVVPALMNAGGLAPSVRQGVWDAVAALERAGAEVVDVELPHLDAAISAYYVIGPCEAFSNLARFDGVRYGYQAPGCASLSEQTSRSRADGFGVEATRRQMLGAYLLSSGVYERYYTAACKARTLISEDFARVFGSVDVLALPVAPDVAFEHGQMSDPTAMYLSDMYTIALNIVGNPGVSVPVGLDEESGMPLAVQLIGDAYKDDVLLGYASVVERAFGSLPVAPEFAQGGAC